jgi:hypothetical protein
VGKQQKRKKMKRVYLKALQYHLLLAVECLNRREQDADEDSPLGTEEIVIDSPNYIVSDVRLTQYGKCQLKHYLLLIDKEHPGKRGFHPDLVTQALELLVEMGLVYERPGPKPNVAPDSEVWEFLTRVGLEPKPHSRHI